MNVVAKLKQVGGDLGICVVNFLSEVQHPVKFCDHKSYQSGDII